MIQALGKPRYWVRTLELRNNHNITVAQYY